MIEQRRCECADFFCPLLLTVLPEGVTVRGRSTDISVAGVGLMTELSLERGQVVRIRFQLGTVNEDIVGRVAYSIANEHDNHVGIEFLEQIHRSQQPVLAEQLYQL